MRAVCLIYIPNTNYLLGTFDADFKRWWIATGFDGVEKIVKGIHIYGEISIAICYKLDKTWSIYQSKDNCLTWHEVYNTTFKIFDIVLIMPGWGIMNAGDGFYESDNAGTDWTKISDLPEPLAPFSAIANVEYADILFCTDGRKVWKSVDYAHNWTLSIDQANFPRHNEDYSTFKSTDETDYTKLYPCIAGANGIVIASYGPFITYTFDLGDTWQRSTLYPGYKFINYWDNYWDAGNFEFHDHGPELPSRYKPKLSGDYIDDEDAVYYHLYHDHKAEINEPPYDQLYRPYPVFLPGFPPKNLVFDRLPTNEDDIQEFVIKQLLVSYVGGMNAWDVRFLLRYDDLVESTAGVSELGLYSRMFYGQLNSIPYPLPESPPIGCAELTWHYLFSQRLINDSNDVTCYELMTPGEDHFDRLVFSAQTMLDEDGTVQPHLMFSIDGGINWTSIDLSDLTIGPSSYEYERSLSDMIGDSYPSSTFLIGHCVNKPTWQRTPGRRTQLQSYDMQLTIAIPPPKPTTYEAAAYISGIATKTYKSASRLENITSKTQLFGSDIIAVHEKKFDMAGYVSGTERLTYWMHRYLEGYPTSTYQMGAIITESTFPEIVLPQAFNVQFPSCAESGYPYDSRIE